MRNKFKFACRKGRNIEVCFDFAPKTWLSTGTKDKKEALEFALERVKRQEKKQETLLADYLRELIEENFGRLKIRNENFGKKLKTTYYNDLTYLSKIYLLPLFGRFILQRLTVKIIEDTLINTFTYLSSLFIKVFLIIITTKNVGDNDITYIYYFF